MSPNLILFLTLERSGGLFDFDGTLPVIGIQFLIFMFLLNTILYTPLLTVINERNQYINKNLAQASIILTQANKLTKQYEDQLLKARKKAQLEIASVQKIHKTILETEIKSSQKIFDNYLIKILNNLKIEKSRILSSLEKEINSLTNEIMVRIVT
jgi:F-type H+-transporting ATPase subunit b